MASDYDTYKCGSTDTASGKPCEREIRAPNEEAAVCWEHEDRQEGAPEGNDFAKGNPGGGAPEGNFNAAKHGLETTLERRVEYYRRLGYAEEYKQIYAHLKEKTRNDMAAQMLASYMIAQLVNEDKLTEDGFFDVVPAVDDDGEPIPDPETGEPIETERLTDAFDGMLKAGKEIRLLGKYEGFTGDDGGGASAHSNKSSLWEDEERDGAAEGEVVEVETVPPETDLPAEMANDGGGD
jgi:hypothetical protein